MNAPRIWQYLISIAWLLLWAALALFVSDILPEPWRFSALPETLRNIGTVILMLCCLVLVVYKIRLFTGRRPAYYDYYFSTKDKDDGNNVT